MDRRSKIIVSVVGIFIVLLALIGITYAYFLTRVEGNTNETSISITTANLRIVYDDNDSQINATNIQPGDTVYTKTFTVTNEGNESVEYAVYLENIINDFVHYKDLRMYITCVSNITGNTCNGYGIDTDSDGDIDLEDKNIYPRVNSKLITNTVTPASEGVNAEVHTYTLYLQFKDNGDQSDDMGKILQGKVQIYDPNSVVAITGNIEVPEGDNTKYYVELHSDVKTSQISSDGTYLFEGVEPQNEAHTLYIKYIDSNGEEQTVGSQKIKVSKGDSANINITNDNKSSLVINEKVLRANINITIGESSISLSNGQVQILDNFEEGTLAAKILSDNTLKNGENLDFDIVENGLYYTGKNTEDNGVTYFYRGNVDNNYLILGNYSPNFTEGYCETTSGVYVYSDLDYNGVTSEEECLNSTICTYDNGEAFSNYCDDIDEWGQYFYPTIHEPGTITIWHDPVYEEFYQPHSIWRIVRINEDGSVRLLYHGDEDSIYNLEPTGIGENEITLGSYVFEEYAGKELMESWYTGEELSNYSSTNFVDVGFCNDITGSYLDIPVADDGTYYEWYLKFNAFTRIENKNPQYSCSNDNLYTTSSSEKGNKKLTYPVGLLTADEVMYAGINVGQNSNESYISSYKNGITISPKIDYIVMQGGFSVYRDNEIYDTLLNALAPSSYYNSGVIYPVINIKGDFNVEGNGTTENPYQIVLEF